MTDLGYIFNLNFKTVYFTWKFHSTWIKIKMDSPLITLWRTVYGGWAVPRAGPAKEYPSYHVSHVSLTLMTSVQCRNCAPTSIRLYYSILWDQHQLWKENLIDTTFCSKKQRVLSKGPKIDNINYLRLVWSHVTKKCQMCTWRLNFIDILFSFPRAKCQTFIYYFCEWKVELSN